jgi:hypothetical protein
MLKSHSAVLFALVVASTLLGLSKATFLKNLCLSDSNCRTGFFKLKNMCRGIKCCNYIEFVFLQSNDKVLSNFLHTLKHPRAINIIIGLSILFLALFIISVVLAVVKKFGLRRVRSVHKTQTVLKEISST